MISTLPCYMFDLLIWSHGSGIQVNKSSLTKLMINNLDTYTSVSKNKGSTYTGARI